MTTHEQCMKSDFVAPLKVSSLVDISIKDHPLKSNCAPNYEKNVSDKHIGIYVQRLFPSCTLFFSYLDFVYLNW